MRQGVVLRAGVHAESHPEGHLSATYKNFHSAIDIGIGAHAIGFKERAVAVAFKIFLKTGTKAEAG
jgi:hypothetical protein